MINEICKVEDIDKQKLLDVLSFIVYYNGIDNFILKLKDDIKHTKKSPNVIYSIMYKEWFRGERAAEVFWMILVQLFGGLGTSPETRFFIYAKQR